MGSQDGDEADERDTFQLILKTREDIREGMRESPTGTPNEEALRREAKTLLGQVSLSRGQHRWRPASYEPSKLNPKGLVQRLIGKRQIEPTTSGSMIKDWSAGGAAHRSHPSSDHRSTSQPQAHHLDTAMLFGKQSSQAHLHDENVTTYEPSEEQTTIEHNRTNITPRQMPRRKGSVKPAPASITSIIARQITKIYAGPIREPHLQEDKEIISSEERYLLDKGYTRQDVDLWTSVLTAKPASAAMSILTRHCRDYDTSLLPLEVLLAFLRRDDITPVPLWKALAHSRRVVEASTALNPTRLLSLFAKLVSQAKKVSPESLNDITDLFLNTLEQGKVSFKSPVTKNAFVNSALALLSDEASVRPFKSATLQESADIKVLQYMNDHQPPLQVERRSYQAIAKVQLRLPKTLDERKWASLKALSWPPFKQDRTAMDSELTRDDGLSKAGSTLDRMAQAGYAPSHIDKVAQTYAGWDTTGTPVIQTRHSLHRPRGPAATWAARMGSTRTLQEAWACWESYKTEQPGISDDTVALIMLKRLHQGSVNQFEPSFQAGDGKELLPLPESTHLHTYTSTQPPTLYGFFRLLSEEERTHGMSPPLASYFLAHADEPWHARLYIAYFRKHQSKLYYVFTHTDENIVESLPEWLVTSAITLLSRNASRTVQPFSSTQIRPRHKFDSGLQDVTFTQRYPLHSKNALVRAIWLAQRLQNPRASAWLPILQAFARGNLRALTEMGGWQIDTQNPSLTDEERSARTAMLSMQSYFMAVHTVDIMTKKVNLDLHSFQQLCTIVEHASSACFNMLSVLSHARFQSLETVLPEIRLAQELRLLLESKPDVRLMEFFNAVAGFDTAADIRLTEPLDAVAGFDTAADAEAEAVAVDASRYPEAALAAEDNAASVSWKDTTFDGSDETEMSPPSMTVEWSTLHTWIRALGWLGAHDATVNLMRRVCQQRHIKMHPDEAPAGQNAKRKCMVALRVFLQREWLQPPTNENIVVEYQQFFTPASNELVREVQDLVRSAFPEESWPSNGAVEEYCVQAGLS